VIFNNITNRKQNELQLINHEKQLETLNETKDKLISIIAHDLRSPFNSIIGFSELLIEEVEHFEIEKIKRFSKIINTSSVNTLNLLDNLLHWAKTQTNQLNFSPEKIEISSIINEVLKTLESTAKFKNISLNYYQKTPNLVVHADLNMLKTILRNLISNSLKFTKSEGFIHIYTKNINNQVEIVIEDNGIGMNEATRANLFKIHKDSTLGTANEKGSGLGLLLCKELIEKHRGEIFIESEEGKGTTFKFTLPID
jgi:signal transduction histidine kinase